jgi:hypothetical protein
VNVYKHPANVVVVVVIKIVKSKNDDGSKYGYNGEEEEFLQNLGWETPWKSPLGKSRSF